MVSFREERCKGCGICVSACPKKIIEMSADGFNSKGFRVAKCADGGACTSCAVCALMCPDVVIEVKK